MGVTAGGQQDDGPVQQNGLRLNFNGVNKPEPRQERHIQEQKEK